MREESKEGTEKLEAWKEAFRKLGTDDRNDPDFDRDFAEGRSGGEGRTSTDRKRRREI